MFVLKCACAGAGHGAGAVPGLYGRWQHSHIQQDSGDGESANVTLLASPSFLFLFSAIFRMNATFNLFLRRHNQRSLQRYEFNSQRKHEYEHAFASDKRVHQMPA